MNSQATAKLVGLFFLGLIALNYPVLWVFSTPVLVFRGPTLFWFIMATWVILILALARLAEKPGRREIPQSQPDQDE